MFPESISLPRMGGLVTRFMMQVAASALLTAFYTPGGAAGWILDLVLRAYLTISRRLPLPMRAWLGRVIAVRLPRIGRFSWKTEQPGRY